METVIYYGGIVAKRTADDTLLQEKIRSHMLHKGKERILKECDERMRNEYADSVTDPSSLLFSYVVNATMVSCETVMRKNDEGGVGRESLAILFASNNQSEMEMLLKEVEAIFIDEKYPSARLMIASKFAPIPLPWQQIVDSYYCPKQLIDCMELLPGAVVQFASQSGSVVGR